MRERIHVGGRFTTKRFLLYKVLKQGKKSKEKTHSNTDTHQEQVTSGSKKAGEDSNSKRDIAKYGGK